MKKTTAAAVGLVLAMLLSACGAGNTADAPDPSSSVGVVDADGKPSSNVKESEKPDKDADPTSSVSGSGESSSSGKPSTRTVVIPAQQEGSPLFLQAAYPAAVFFFWQPWRDPCHAAPSADAPHFRTTPAGKKSLRRSHASFIRISGSCPFCLPSCSSYRRRSQPGPPSSFSQRP